MTQPVSLTKPGAAQSPRPALEIFDPPMCCSTGLCGPSLDQTLLDVNDLVLALQAEGVTLGRYQMSSRPDAFLSNAEVMRLVRERNLEALPITMVGGRVIATGAYPSAAEVRAALAEQSQ
jgi:hypothetical protein